MNSFSSLTIALKSDGTLLAFGDGGNGAIGNGDVKSRYWPTEVMTNIMLPQIPTGSIVADNFPENGNNPSFWARELIAKAMGEGLVVANSSPSWREPTSRVGAMEVMTNLMERISGKNEYSEHFFTVRPPEFDIRTAVI